MQDVVTVLIVDDDPLGRAGIESLLENETYHVIFAKSGLTALEQAKRHRPDLILMDVMIPEMDGYDVCRSLRADPYLAEIPVILMTDSDDRDSRVQGLEAGADDFVSKPMDRVEVEARVRTITQLNRYRLLLAERDRFERLIELSPDGILIVDHTGHIHLANTAIARMLCADRRADVFGHPMLIFIPEQQAEDFTLWLEQVIADSLPNVGREMMLHRLDGTMMPIEVNAGAFVWENYPAVQMIIRDITERKRATEALQLAHQELQLLNQQLQHSRNVLRTLFDGLTDGLALINREGVVLAANHPLALLFRTKVEQLPYRPWHEICSSLAPPFPATWVLQTLDDGITRSERVTYRDDNGNHYVLDIATLPLRATEQSMEQIEQIEQMVVRVVDVTERVQLEQMALENERFAANGRLAATVAHEINTPLYTIKTSLYLAEQAEESSRRTTYLHLAQDELDRVGHIVRQLLNLYRPDDGSSIAIDWPLLLDRVLLLTGSILKTHGITVERYQLPDVTQFWGHPHHIIQVMLNLIMNAVDAMPDGGTLRISSTTLQRFVSSQPNGNPKRPIPQMSKQAASIDEQLLVIEIADTGIGIDPDIQARIFEPFFTTKPTGTGLGLAISRKLVQQHGGDIWVKSYPNGGSVFTILFPVKHQFQEGEE